jgi:ADP-ribose pyrophosphatase YjhB (NUDIX family)
MVNKLVKFVYRSLPGSLRLRAVRAVQSKFTASTAAMVFNDRGEVLLLKHAMRPFSAWGLPGGFIDRGEQPETAIRRELMEEAGIELTELQMYRVRTIRSHIEILYTAHSSGVAEVSSREIVDLGWFRPDSFPEGLGYGQRELIEKVMAGRN